MHPALGIDYGDVRMGLAITDGAGIMAHPLETIDRRRTEPVARIAELCRQRGVRSLVVGLPLRLDGSEGEKVEAVRAFARTLQARLPELPMAFIDETFTTTTAAEKLREAGLKAERQRPVIDQAAAVEILNAWLETLGS